MIVYKATCVVTGKVYIGITQKSLKQRKAIHETKATQGKQEHFRRALRKYGFDNFKWEVIDNAEKWEELCELEKVYIEKFDSFNNGYNSTLGGDGAFGVKWTEERRKEHSALMLTNHPFKGKKFSEETRKRIGNAKKGQTLSEEAKKKISKAHKGKRLSEETKMKIGQAQIGDKHHAWGKHHTKEHRNKISKALTGIGNPSAKLDEAKVIEIKILLQKGVKQKTLQNSLTLVLELLTQLNLEEDGLMLKYQTTYREEFTCL